MKFHIFSVSSTADIKNLYVKVGNDSTPFLGILAELIKRGVGVRMIHAKEHGRDRQEKSFETEQFDSI